MDNEGYAGNCEAIGAADLSADTGRIRAPTLVLTGSADPSVAPELSRGLADAIAGAAFIEHRTGGRIHANRARFLDGAVVGLKVRSGRV